MEKGKNFWKYVEYATSLAGILIAPPLVGLFIGRWVDGAFHSAPLATLGLFMLGLVTGLYSMVKDVTKS